MGDFDDWTRGQELSAEDASGGGGDSVFARFEGRVLLRPGRYRVKLKVRPFCVCGCFLSHLLRCLFWLQPLAVRIGH